MKDSCSSFSELLEKYFDQEVSEKEKSLVEAHLQHCPTCQETLKSMEGVRNLIKNPVEEAVRKEDFPWVWEKIQRGIQLKEKRSGWEALRSWIGLSPLLQKKIWMSATAAIIIFLFATAQFVFKKTPLYPDPSVVEFAESQTHHVMVYESEKGMVTVIWHFEEPEKESPAS